MLRLLKRLPGSRLATRVGMLVKSKRRQKEDWEFEWQRSHWCELFQDPINREKVLDYWMKYRHLGDIRARIALDDRSRVLDVGCGISTVLHYLPGDRYGIDPLADRYKTIYDYPEEIDIRVGYGESIPFSSNFFDAVVCSNAIDHAESPRQTVQEVLRVLKPGGHFVLTCEVFTSDIGKRNAGHPHSMTSDALHQLVEGFRIVDHWDSPWVGMRNYVLGRLTAHQSEHVCLLRKP